MRITDIEEPWWSMIQMALSVVFACVGFWAVTRLIVWIDEQKALDREQKIECMASPRCWDAPKGGQHEDRQVGDRDTPESER